MKEYQGKTVVIVGPTGSGKTGVSIQLAKDLGRDEEGRYNGEIISADSRAIYRHIDIGTAKPSMEEQSGVVHFGLDLVEPGERFTVADWQAYTKEKIAEIKGRGHVPIVVGGTGLYIDALVFDYQFGREKGNIEQKNCSDKTGVDCDFATKYPDRVEMSPEYEIYGVSWDSNELRERLKKRAKKMFSEELYAETRFLVQKYGWNSQAMKSNIYQFVWKYLNGEINFDTALEQFFYDDWHLAKRQMTWFKRNKQIKWCRLEEIEQKILQDLAKNL